jgi:hypothetical protein
MREIYYKIVRLIGYTIIVHHKYNTETFELEKKYAYVGVYKYLGRYKHDKSLRMVRIWEIKIR